MGHSILPSRIESLLWFDSEEYFDLLVVKVPAASILRECLRKSNWISLCFHVGFIMQVP